MFAAEKHRRGAGVGRSVLEWTGIALLFLCATSASGTEVRYVGAIADGPKAPTSLAAYGSGLAVLEPFARQLHVFTADGILASRIDISGEARGLARLRDGVYLFCDVDAKAVKAVELDGGMQSVFLETPGQPVDVIVSGGECFVLEGAQRNIVVTDLSGFVTGTVSLPLPAGLEAGWLADLAYDPVREVFHVLDQTHSRVLAYGRNGDYLGTYSGFGTHDGQLSRGGGIACDPAGWIYVTDRYQGRVVVFEPDWSFAVNVDPADLGRDRLKTPTGFAVDEEGFLYVAATEGASIHIFHLDKSSASLGDLLARPLTPGFGQEMPVDNLHFVAGIQVPLEQADATVGDFRLFDMADILEPIAETAAVPLEGGTTLGDIVLGSVSWRPSVTLTEGREYGWQARARAGAVEGAWMELSTFVPTAAALPFRLEQNTPNPFNPRTVIVFSLKDDSPADLSIYDVRGNQVWTEDLTGSGPGTHQVIWEGRNSQGRTLPSGVYFYRLVSGAAVATRKMVLMR